MHFHVARAGFWRRLLLISILGLLPFSAWCAAKPNVLIIVADDMGFSDLGSYGGEIRTPNLDALAKRGLRFTQFYNTARCWPTRTSLLTGYYAQGIRRDTLPGVDITLGASVVRPRWAAALPELLKPAGYRSYHSGKWHVNGTPLENGFDRSFDLEEFYGHFSVQRYTEDGQPRPPVEADRGFYATVAIADHAIRHLKDHAEKYPDRPFFEYLAFTAPHFPLHALPEDIAPYRHRYDRGWDVLRRERWQRNRKMGLVKTPFHEMERDVGPPYELPADIEKLGPDEIARPVAWESLSAKQKAFQSTKMAIHAAMIDRMDREIGRVIEQLKAMQALDNTLVLFLSDNGASAEMMVRGDGHDPDAPPGSWKTFLSLGPGWSSAANTPFRRHKIWVHEGGIATPLIAHWPRGIGDRGMMRSTPGHIVDVVPTVLELAGVDAPATRNGLAVPDRPGRSLVPVLTRNTQVGRDYLWWMHEGNRALRIGDWKIVSSDDRSQWSLAALVKPLSFQTLLQKAMEFPWELYDLSEDRAEMNNLAEKYPDKVREMADIWMKELEHERALALQDLPRTDGK